MSLVNEEIVFENLIRNKRILSDPRYQRLLAGLRRRIQTSENKYLQNYSPCSNSDLKQISSRISNLKPDILKKLLTNNIYDMNILKGSSCMINSLLHFNK